MTNGVVNAGVANFTKQFAHHAASHQVTVNCVHPGYTATRRVLRIFEREASAVLIFPTDWESTRHPRPCQTLPVELDLILPLQIKHAIGYIL